jgi:hypothetical protein
VFLQLPDPILTRKKKFSSSDGGNSIPILPSTTDNESGITVKGVKVFRSVKRWMT